MLNKIILLAVFMPVTCLGVRDQGYSFFSSDGTKIGLFYRGDCLKGFASYSLQQKVMLPFNPASIRSPKGCYPMIPVPNCKVAREAYLRSFLNFSER